MKLSTILAPLAIAGVMSPAMAQHHRRTEVISRNHWPTIVDRTHYRYWNGNGWSINLFAGDAWPTEGEWRSRRYRTTVVDPYHYRYYHGGHWVTREFGYRHPWH